MGRCPSWNLKVMATARSTRLRRFGIVRFVPRSRREAICQAFNTWFCEKATQKKKILGSLHQPSNTFGGSSAPTIGSIRKNQQRPHLQLIPLHQWSGQQLSQPIKKSAVDRLRPQAQTNPLKRAEVLIFTSFLALSLPRQKTSSLS